MKTSMHMQVPAGTSGQCILLAAMHESRQQEHIHDNCERCLVNLACIPTSSVKNGE